MKIGDTVKHKINGAIGKVEYSTFGFSIHIYDEYGSLGKTLGCSEGELLKYWEVVE